MRVAVAQLRGQGGSVAERVARAEAAAAEAAAAGATLLALPEAFLPGYRHEAARAGAEARAWMGGAAARHGLVVVGGYLDEDEGGPGCFAGVADPGGGWTAYRKRFLSPDEARVWRPGREARVVETAVGRVGVLICADLLHPAAWRPLRGAVDGVVVIAAWPDYRGRAAGLPGPLRPLLRPVFAGAGPERDRVLAGASRWLGVPVVFADACGPWRGEEGFAGGSGVWEGGEVRWRGGGGEELGVVEIGGAVPGSGRWPGSAAWRGFGWLYRGAAGLRGALGHRLSR